MVESGKKVNFYRLALRRGKMHRMTLSEDDRLTGEGGGMFYYLAPVFDSNDYGGTWHRLRLEGTFSDCKYEILAAATDVDLEAILKDESLDFSGRGEVLKEHSHVRKVNTEDLLLHDLAGRYLWILITVAGSKIDSHFRIEGFSAEFPKSSFIEYLPEVYQQEDQGFFERYMAVFRSMYEDLEKEVDRIPMYLDYQTAPEKNLELFAKWTGRWNENGQWSPKALRYLIRHLQKIQTGRGTRKVMGEIIWLLTGQRAVLVEHFQWKDWMKKNASLLDEFYRLYGEEEDTFAVVIDATEKEVGMSERELEKKLEDYTPFGMICKVIYLKKNSHMDAQSYLDKNSYLSTPEHPNTEGFVLGEELILQ